MDRLPNEYGISVTVSSRFHFVAVFCGGLFSVSLDVRTSGGAIIDFHNHATVFLADTPTWKTNTAGKTASDFTLQTCRLRVA